MIDTDVLDCDGDGLALSDAPATDCDDARADVNPSRPEAVGDEVDGDCDGFEDCYVDADGDGYRTMEVVQSFDSDCTDEGEAAWDVPMVDCDDTRAGVHPGAEEIPGDGVDQDCDGTDPAVADDSGDTDAADDDEAEEDLLEVIVTTDPVEVDLDQPAAAGDKGGCGCAARSGNPSGVVWWGGILGLVGLMRRRKSCKRIVEGRW
jgi:MYXO-CTERM domain-containing protein